MENNVWAFGQGYGLDFSDPPRPKSIGTLMETIEGCASVSDKDGHLLFYSNGQKVWDNTHNVMPNGTDILGNGPRGMISIGSSTQGVCIVPFVGKPNLYYLFVLDAEPDIYDDYKGYLRYSVIDMSLNGGLGDVVAAEKNILIDSFVGEKMITIKGAGCMAWLIVHRHDTNEFHSYKIDASGLNKLPIISQSGFAKGKDCYMWFEMKANFVGDKIANVAIFNDTTFYTGLELHDFDRNTGLVSNATFLCKDIDYGVEFSPDGNILYSSEAFGNLFQYNLSYLPDIEMLNSNRYNVTNFSADYSWGQSGCRMSRDNKIYFVYFVNDPVVYLSRVNYPNVFGEGCKYEREVGGYRISADIPSFYGLGNNVVNPNIIDTIYSYARKVDCLGSSIQLSCKQGDAYLWSTGETSQNISVTESSTVWVTTKVDACRVNIDTFKVGLPKIFSNFKNTVVCNDQMVVLDAMTEGASYKWQDGSSGATFSTNQMGQYWVNVITPECNITDTITVGDGTFSVNLGNDQTLCLEEEFKLQPNIVGDYLWQDASTAPTFNVTESGKYWVKVSKGSCFALDTVIFTKLKCNNCLSIPNAFTPNNDGNNDLFRPIISCPILQFTFKIVNRYGQVVFESKNAQNYWDGKINN